MSEPQTDVRLVGVGSSRLRWFGLAAAVLIPVLLIFWLAKQEWGPTRADRSRNDTEIAAPTMGLERMGSDEPTTSGTAEFRPSRSHASDHDRVGATDPSMSIVAGVVRSKEGPVGAAYVYLKSGRLLLESSTDSTGRFRFSFDDEGSVTVGAWHLNYGPSRSTTVAERGTTRTVELVVRPGATLRCDIVDSRTRAPISGAHVYLIDAGSPETLQGVNAGSRRRALEQAAEGMAPELLRAVAVGEFADLATASRLTRLPPRTTDAGGAVSFPGLPVGKARLAIVHPSYAPRQVECPVKLGAARTTIEMDRGSSIRVVLPRTIPAHTDSGDVYCNLERAGSVSVPVGPPRRVEGGTIVYSGLAAGEYTIVLSKGPAWSVSVVVAETNASRDSIRLVRLQSSIMFATRLAVNANSDHFIDLSSIDFSVVRGRVRKDGKPVPRCLITLLSSGEPERELGACSTDHDGTFNLGMVPPGLHKLLAMTLDGTRKEITITVHSQGATPFVEIELDGGPVTGSVHGFRGGPLQAQVVLEPAGRADGAGETPTRSVLRGFEVTRADSNGKFSYASVPNVAHWLYVSDGRHFDVRLLKPEDLSKPIEVRFDAGGYALMDVAAIDDLTGAVVPSRFVFVGQIGRPETWVGIAARIVNRSTLRATTEIVAPVGSHRLLVGAPGWVPRVVSVSSRPGGSVAARLQRGAEVELELGESSAGRRVELRRNSESLLDLAFSIGGFPHTRLSTTTNTVGLARLRCVPQGTYDVRIGGSTVGVIDVQDRARQLFNLVSLPKIGRRKVR